MFASLSPAWWRLRRFCLPGIMFSGIVCAVLCHRPAWASPEDDPALGGAVFTGPAHPHPTSILVNPAAIGIDGTHSLVYLGGGGQLDQYGVQRQRLLDPNADFTPGTNVSSLSLAPTGWLIAQYKASKGAMLATAFGLPMHEHFIGSGDPGDQDIGYHTLGGHHRQWDVTVATSVRVNRRLYVGTSLSWVKTTMALSFLRDTALEGGSAGIQAMCGDAPCGIENPMAAERWAVDTGSSGFVDSLSLRAGFVYHVAQDWWFGASYVSPPGLQATVSLNGTATIERAPMDRADPAVPELIHGNAEIVYKLPVVVTVGMRGRIIGGWQVMASARWQNLSRSHVLDVRVFGRDVPADIPEWLPRYRGLRDAFSAQAGVEHLQLANWRLGARLRFDRGVTASDAKSPMQIEGPSVSGVLGAEWRLTDRLVVSGNYGLSWYFLAPVTDSAYDPRDQLTCVDGGFDLDDCQATAEGRAIPSAAGTYSRVGHALNLSVRYLWL